MRENHSTAHRAAKNNPALKMLPVLLFLMSALVAADEPMDLIVPVDTDSASALVVHCDAATVCPDGTTCCLSPFGVWSCCPYSMGQCCRDGVHCCRHGYRCDSTSTHCLRGWLRQPSYSQATVKVHQKTQAETVQCEGNVYCPAEKFCCRQATGQWGCCNGLEL